MSSFLCAPDDLYRAFITRLRARYSKIPLEGISVNLPVYCLAGTATGFSDVDIGGNWLRSYRAGALGVEPSAERVGLRTVVDVADRQGDKRRRRLASDLRVRSSELTY